MDKSRFKNYGLWLSIAALVPMVLKGFGVNILPDNYEEIVTALLSILVMAGILNNPTTECKGFGDDKCKISEAEKVENVENVQIDEATAETIAKENSEGK